MDVYHIWFNLKDSKKDMEFSQDLEAYMGFLKDHDAIEGYRLTRRKLGLGGEGLAEFNVAIEFKNLAQLDEAFSLAAVRTGEVESHHAKVYSAVSDIKFGLYRDFPDPQREK